ncbi:hypothetical protein TeGR_g9043, partial [Tetraparma gracilis]
MTWGNAHSDLDSYLVVPAESKSDPKCQIDYGSKTCGNIYSDVASSAVLDVDDTNDYGPETITIKNPHPGTYSYFIHIYAGNGKCWDTSGIKAQIEVWSGEAGGLISSYTQPIENPEYPDSCGETPEDTCHQAWHVLDCTWQSSGS